MIQSNPVNDNFLLRNHLEIKMKKSFINIRMQDKSLENLTAWEKIS